MMGTTFIRLVLVSRRERYLSKIALDVPLCISKYLYTPLNSLPIGHELYVAVMLPSPIFVMPISKLHKKLNRLKLKDVATT
jgi:hypothetical protein